MTTNSFEEKRTLDQEIDRLLTHMNSLNLNSEEYNQDMDNLKILYELKGIKSHKDISYDTLLTVGANILGILIVLNFERTGIVTSKAFSWLFRK